jgi:GNAT superfamily N-acetyltransferase
MINYQIRDLTEEDAELFCMCLEDWSDEMKEAGDHKRRWYGKMKEKGLGAKLAYDENGVAGGMIQYYPIEYSAAKGSDLYFIQCIWVHGYKEGRGNFQKKGMGTALLAAAEEDVRERGAKGLACWGVSMPFWMKASWFKKHGYIQTDNEKGAVLLWKQFTEDAEAPVWRKPEKPVPALSEDGKPLAVGFVHGVCPAMNLVFERVRRAAEEFPGRVELKVFDTSLPAVLEEWGRADGVYIAGKEVRNGPPPSYKKVLKIMKRAVKAKS